ncbi:MAG: GNAT family N-acetyltransferase [Clostridiales bacterium]|nr:GNAT family N-acetyltransferase [Clostridiales bacterium]
MEFQKAGEAQIERLAALYADARAAIAAFSIDQWQDGYPRVSDIENDIRRDELWIGMTGERIDCAAALLCGKPGETSVEHTYDRIEDGAWLTCTRTEYAAVHRVACASWARGTGCASRMMTYLAELARGKGKLSLRIDTHEGNLAMRKMLAKNGFVYCGVIYLAGGDKRVAYERIL